MEDHKSSPRNQDALFLYSVVPFQAVREVFAKYLRRAPPGEIENHAYNVVQRLSYLSVIFVLFPGVIWTGLALSPAFNAAFPFFVNVLGGRQSARTLHFFITDLLVLFLIVHVGMIAITGFRSRMRAMITGRVTPSSISPASEAK